jgi:predicted nucleotidyltransferase component of viral defense system
MIDRAEILAVATDLSLAPDVVEKDYVLGWLLAGIYAHDKLALAWAFKGGTCLKKCYFETYRFFEDLDSTISDQSHLDEGFLKVTFAEIATWLYDEIGLEIPTGQLRFDVYRNKRNGLSCEGRVYYSGPLGRSGNLPRIKLDLTVDETLALPPVERPVGHSYSDLPGGGIKARCYAYEEVFGEKIRALGERTRPRDLYDVINLFRHGEFRPAPAVILDVLKKKCAFKGIAVPTFVGLAGATAELLGDWQAMLGHQLPVLLPFETFWNALPEFFAWLEGSAALPALATAPLGAQEEVFRPAVGLLRRQGVLGSSFLEIIRFAAVNRLCVDLGYQGSRRRIEPYSLRRTRAGDILLYAVRANSGESRSYRLDRVQSAEVKSESFAPRFAVELASSELGAIPPTTRGVAPARGLTTVRPRSVARALRASNRPTYIYQCGLCGKRFKRKTRDAGLRSHKAPQGWACSSRTGWLVDTKY